MMPQRRCFVFGEALFLLSEFLLFVSREKMSSIVSWQKPPLEKCNKRITHSLLCASIARQQYIGTATETAKNTQEKRK
jgi:hypothetical protein